MVFDPDCNGEYVRSGKFYAQQVQLDNKHYLRGEIRINELPLPIEEQLRYSLVNASHATLRQSEIPKELRFNKDLASRIEANFFVVETKPTNDVRTMKVEQAIGAIMNTFVFQYLKLKPVKAEIKKKK